MPRQRQNPRQKADPSNSETKPETSRQHQQPTGHHSLQTSQPLAAAHSHSTTVTHTRTSPPRASITPSTRPKHAATSPPPRKKTRPASHPARCPQDHRRGKNFSSYLPRCEPGRRYVIEAPLVLHTHPTGQAQPSLSPCSAGATNNHPARIAPHQRRNNTPTSAAGERQKDTWCVLLENKKKKKSTHQPCGNGRCRPAKTTTHLPSAHPSGRRSGRTGGRALRSSNQLGPSRLLWRSGLQSIGANRKTNKSQDDENNKNQTPVVLVSGATIE